MDMEGILVSSGSACTAGSIDPSHVLVAMFGDGAEEIRSSIRFSFGIGLTDGEIAEAGKRTAAIVKRLVKTSKIKTSRLLRGLSKRKGE